jgi:hypothetical protein
VEIILMRAEEQWWVLRWQVEQWWVLGTGGIVDSLKNDS